MSMFHRVFTPPCLCFTVCLLHHVYVSLCVYSTMSMFHCVFTPPCLCFTVSLLHHVYVSPFLYSTMSMFHYVLTPPCLDVPPWTGGFFVSWCQCSWLGVRTVATGGLISSHWEVLIKPKTRCATNTLCHHYATSRVTKLGLGLEL